MGNVFEEEEMTKWGSLGVEGIQGAGITGRRSSV
jgi:hypothetical protein